MPPVNLKFMSSLADMGQNLTDEERRLGRRLVRFFRKHVGDDLLVSSRPIRQEEYNERLVVISCIYRHETAERWVTSVDIIYLLQYFVQEAFSVEEKNRIRRNLEMFAPITISKTKVEQEHFFKQIMGFPVPRPRHIEKDIKVFKWKKLAPALDKIMQKYSVFTVDIASENATLWPPHQPAPPNLTPPAPAFYDTPQHPSSFPPAPLATFDGAHLSIGSSQLSFAPPTHISPSQLHLQGMIDPTAQGPSDGGDLSGPHMPQPHVAGDDGHDPTYDPGTAFHNVDSLEFQIIHEHNSNDGMPTPQFI
ncbi:hypothetical protein BC834DRAFT_968225 [Gloeopeniophorella convolvens]|nr:hypothetical protein BC834DRAFT_968225 [Gloeopeniophorella convolvens]